jgi:putative tricarboxylic transport membrane protein
LTSGKKIAAVCFAIAGVVAGHVGYDQLHNVRFLTFGIPELDGGLSLFPIFCGLIIIPTLWQQKSTDSALRNISIDSVNFLDRLRLLIDWTHWSSVIRGGVIGFAVGLIPGGSYLISSNIAGAVEGKIVGSDQSIKQLIAAESANNSGSISVLIPLLLLAIPIVFSEAVILGIAESKGFSYTTSLELFDQNFWYIMAVLVVANLINWGLAGFFYNVIISVYTYLSKYVYLIATLVCLGILAWQGYQEYRLWFSIINFLIALTVGLLTTRYNDEKFVFVYTYFVSTIMSDEIYRQFII